MALWVDCQNLTASDLLPYDGQLSTVVSTEGIDVDSKSQLAHAQISDILAARFLCQPNSRRDQGAGIVVTAPLRRWHAFLTLESVYREAFFRHLSERYKSRSDYLKVKADEAMEIVLEAGVGICEVPIRRAPQPDVSATSGGISGGVWHVAVTLVEAGIEGEGSEIASIILSDSSGIAVRLPGANVTGGCMHVYAGSTPEQLFRQTESAVPAGNELVIAAIAQEGHRMGWGQPPDRFAQIERRILRG